MQDAMHPVAYLQQFFASAIQSKYECYTAVVSRSQDTSVPFVSLLDTVLGHRELQIMMHLKGLRHVEPVS
jgi:hypothetical protein